MELDEFQKHDTKSAFKGLIEIPLRTKYLGTKKRCCISVGAATLNRGKILSEKLGISFSKFIEAIINEQYRLYLMANKDISMRISLRDDSQREGDRKSLDPLPDFPLQTDVVVPLEK